MKHIVLIFLSLLAIFFAAWGMKAQNPINRPENIEDGSETPWYETRHVTPKADEEWHLDPEIPLNYIPVPGEDELYMVVNDSGEILSYRQRERAQDGAWVWRDVNPDIPEDYKKAEGLENVYKTSGEDGAENYYLYVRNEDDTFCFVPVDERGIPLDDGKSADRIGGNYIHAEDNVYAVYDGNNVKMGYRRRAKEEKDCYVWKVCEAPDDKKGTEKKDKTDGGKKKGGFLTDGGKTVVGNSADSSRKEHGDGTYSVTDRTIDVREEEGYSVTYQTIVYSTYDKTGKLMSTKKDGPYEISRIPMSGSIAVDKSKIAQTLDGEFARVSASVEFDTDMAGNVLAKLNAERKKQGLQSLSMNKDSKSYKIACIRAADMAIYNHASSESPMYGTLRQLLGRFACSSTHPSENIWRAAKKSAPDIHTRFQANEDSRKVRMSEGYSEAGISVVEKDGQTYVVEVYLE